MGIAHELTAFAAPVIASGRTRAMPKRNRTSIHLVSTANTDMLFEEGTP
ncbi:hypothetical protein ACLESO_12445 [Pyxidicoccus sp. 3LG]